MTVHAIVGGIGDIMQCVDDAVKVSDQGGSVRFITHQPKNTIEEIADLFNITVDSVVPFKTIEELQELLPENTAPLITPKQYCSTLVSSGRIWDDKPNRCILHPMGSQFSNEVLLARGEAPKNMAIDSIQLLTLYLGNIMKCPIGIVMSPKEWDTVEPHLKAFTKHYFRIDDIKTAISASATCDVLVGTDSAMKTVSSVFKRKTIVMMPAGEDMYRDERFIIPYVNAGNMIAFKYTKQAYSSVEMYLTLGMVVGTVSRGMAYGFQHPL